MKKNVLVSIIVPVYNVEKYLKRCLETIVAQTLKDIEIILVNDGSTDNSGEICDEYQKQYPDLIKLIHQENKGLGPARNAGLAIAVGEYIGFVDSDDWIAIDMYEKLYNYANLNQYGMVFSDMFYVDAEKSTITMSAAFYKKEACSVTSEEAFINGIYCYAVNKLYRLDLIKELKFPHLVFEDIPVITTIISNCGIIGYLPESLYFYERKPGTLSTTYKSASMLDTIEVENLALAGVSAESRDVLLFAFAKRFLQNIFSERKVITADLVEHINCYSEELKNNAYIEKYKRAQIIYKYLNHPTIPKNIYYANFEERSYEIFEKACIDSWSSLTRGFHIVELNSKNCDIGTAPESVCQAYESKNYTFVNEYYKLKSVYENGGIAIEPDIYFSAPIGQLRMEQTFFGFKNKTQLLNQIYGSVASSNVLRALMETYSDNGIYADHQIPFIERLTSLLISQYGLKEAGWSQNLEEKIKIYKCDTLAYDMHSSNNITKLMTTEAYPLLGTDFEIIDKSILNYWSTDRDNFWRQKEEIRKATEKNGFGKDKETATLQRQLNEAYSEIAMYKNSKSWKITEPLRRLYSLTHKA